MTNAIINASFTKMWGNVKVNSWFWLGYFILSIIVIGGIWGYGFILPFHVLGRWSPTCKKIADRAMCAGVKVLMGVQPWLDAEYDFKEVDRLSNQSALLVSNHRSTIDPFLFLLNVHSVRIFAKESIFYVPFMGAIMWASKQIPVRRGRVPAFLKALDIAGKRLREGDKVHVFPEMTRCVFGFRGTREFALAPFWVAVQENVPVIPIAIQGTDEAWPKGVSGIFPGKKVSVRALACLHPRDYTSAEELRAAAQLRIQQAIS